MRQGEIGNTFALLLDGEVAITRTIDGRVRHLADARRGAILGELAILRKQPRTATVTATVPSLVTVGTAEALLRLLDHEAVLMRLRRLTSSRLAHDVTPVPISLRDGHRVALRPLLPEDRDGYLQAVLSMSPTSRRRRFFSPGAPSESMLDYLLDIDYVDHFAWLVLDPRDPALGVAVARYVRDSTDHQLAEVAFGIVDRYQGRGLGTLLLGAVGVACSEAGIKTMVGEVLEDNAPMRAVFAKAGGVSDFGSLGVVHVRVDPVTAMRLLAEPLRVSLRTAVHDIVTAATLALTV